MTDQKRLHRNIVTLMQLRAEVVRLRVTRPYVADWARDLFRFTLRETRGLRRKGQGVSG